jgi:hypothetical protein
MRRELTSLESLPLPLARSDSTYPLSMTLPVKDLVVVFADAGGGRWFMSAIMLTPPILSVINLLTLLVGGGKGSASCGAETVGTAGGGGGEGRVVTLEG